MLSLKKSFRLSKDRILKSATQTQGSAVLVSEKPIVDVKRRNFLKTLGVIGAGVVGASILPKKSQAMNMGAATGTNVVGFKDSSDLTIDPATEGTLDSSRIATEATKISFDSIKTNTDTLVTNSNKFIFTGPNLNIEKEANSEYKVFEDRKANTISASSEDAVVMLRRIVKLMESKATVDTANRRRIALDGWADNTMGPMESGTATGTQNLIQLVDTTKSDRWIENKWSYYAVKITAGTGIGQLRTIITNTTTALTLIAPWTIIPDATSVYGIYDISMPVLDYGVAQGTQGLLTLANTARAWTVSAWINYAVRINSSLEGTQIRLITANTATVLTYAYPWTPILGKTANLDSGIAIGEQSATTLQDTTKTWTVDAWINNLLVITGGSGEAQAFIIASNTADTLTIQYPWPILIDATSTYAIRTLPTDGLDSGTASGQPSSAILFDDLTKNWTTNVWANYLIKITSGHGAGQVRQIVSNTATQLTISADWAILPSPSSTYAIYAMPAREYYISLVPAASTDFGTIAGMPRLALGTDSTVGTVSNINSLNLVGSYVAQQRFGDVSHKVYNDSIRSKLTFN